MRKTIAMIVVLGGLLLAPEFALSQDLGFTAQPGTGAATSERGDYFVVPMQTGSKSRQPLALRNDSSAPISVKLAPVDAKTGSIGGVSYNLIEEPREHVGSWITLDDGDVTIPAKGQTTVHFDVAVPQQVQPGQHVGALAIWLPKDESPLPSRTGAGASISVRTRRIIAVQVDLPGGIGPHLTITNVEPAARPDGLYLEIAINHDGHRLTRGTGFIELKSDSFRNDFQLDTFVPGTAIRYPIMWSAGNKEGKFTGHVEIHYDGLVAIWDGEVEVGQKVKEELEERLVQPTGSVASSEGGGGLFSSLPSWAVPTVIGFGGGALVPLMVFLFRRRKRKTAADEA